MSAIQARNIVEAELRRELFGPNDNDEPIGQPLNCSSPSIHLLESHDPKGQFHEATTLQEIITVGNPLSRYGIGVLHGGASKDTSKENSNTDDIETLGVPGLPHNEEDPDGPALQIKGTLHADEADADDFELSGANSFKPSSMGVSFHCLVSRGSSLRIDVSGAYYDKLSVHVPGKAEATVWWVRRPFHLVGRTSEKELLEAGSAPQVLEMSSDAQPPRILPQVQILSRPVPKEKDPNSRLITVIVRNRESSPEPGSAFFQLDFSASVENGLTFQPYPQITPSEQDEEEQSLDLLYRKKQTYAIGHGCAAEWKADDSSRVTTVRGAALPAYQIVNLSPNIYLEDDDGNFLLDERGHRQAVYVSMLELSQGSDLGDSQVTTILRLYEDWIEARTAEIKDLPTQYQKAAHRHMSQATHALNRMRSGWELVQTHAIARQAFLWANEAMLHQQIRSSLRLRRVTPDKNGIYQVTSPHPEATVPPGRGNWRPFQIAFILATLPELINSESEERTTVDLIFFPTGGGKTEAYLGASAISMFARRLRDSTDTGTDTIMRYTLRLLTAQQFLRAASLICVLEDIRSRYPDELGETPFSIGIWVGRATTPNTWRQAIDDYEQLSTSPSAQNRFLLLRCPWCGTQMGPMSSGRKKKTLVGYRKRGKQVIFRCIDKECRYSVGKGLPIHVVDEDIYNVRPSLIIGTVDKFAMLTWLPRARSLFGIDDQGNRDTSPPSLIIQDELHLISGPLGSMVGLYEPIIEELCTDYRQGKNIRPKIIAATATIRRYQQQVKNLFGRDRAALFPPHGLEEGRTFFAEPARLTDGSYEPGRRYLGVMSASLGSTQTVQTRVASATLQAAKKIPEADRDAYWTNLNFFNSLRELGNTVSLLNSDVPDYLTGLKRRDGIIPRWPRPHRVMELTSRRRADEIPQAIDELQREYVPDKDSQEAIDICLASNIIEVGIDIDRLGLMTIVGQPKTTAQYIQVSGRVGRRAAEAPGLVITIYGAAKPRDRSHYERFYTYHQQLYAQVEPTSVTPFATPVLMRALHAAAISYIRQTAPTELKPFPFPADEYAAAIDLLRERALLVDGREVPALERISNLREKEWWSWERTEWDANITGDPQQGLMRYAGTLPDPNRKTPIWSVPSSMRNVDAECHLEITNAYAISESESE